MGATQSIRTSTTTGTIPAATTLSGGTAVTDTNKTTVLIYTGTDNLLTTLAPILTGQEGLIWIYIVNATTNTLARCIGVTAVDESNPAALVYAILLDRVMTTGAAKTVTYITADLKKYSVTNDGGASGTFDGVALLDGETVTQEIQYPLTVDWLEAKTFNATGTSFLITQNK